MNGKQEEAFKALKYLLRSEKGKVRLNPIPLETWKAFYNDL